MARERRQPAPLPPLPLPGVRPHQRIRELRMQRGLSQAQLATLAGIRKATLVNIEREHTQIPTQETLRRLAAAFGMTLEELRRQLGIHGPLYVLPVLQHHLPEDRRFSPRAEQIAGLVDLLPVEEQDLIDTLCRYLHARRSVNLPVDHMVREL